MRNILLPLFFVLFGILGGVFFGEGMLQLLNAFHMVNIDPKKSFATDHFVYSPTLKYTVKPYRTRNCTAPTNPKAICYSNMYGFRDKDHEVRKAENTYRILLIGDSLTYGPGVNWEDSYPGILERLIAAKNKSGMQVEIINLGMIFYAPQNYYSVYQEYGKQYKADLTILSFHLLTDPYDAYDFDTNKKFYLIKSLPDRMPYAISQPLKEHSLLWRTLLSGYYSWANKQEVPVETIVFKGQKNRFQHDAALDTTSPFMKKGWELAASFMQKLITEVSSNGSKVIVVSFPPPTQIDPNAWKQLQKEGDIASEKMYTDSQSRKMFLSICAKNKWPCLDLHDNLRKEKDPSTLFLKNDIHYTKEGNMIAAHTIYEGIKKYLPH